MIKGVGSWVALIGAAFLWIKTAEKLTKPKWYGILIFVPIVNLFILWDMAK